MKVYVRMQEGEHHCISSNCHKVSSQTLAHHTTRLVEDIRNYHFTEPFHKFEVYSPLEKIPPHDRIDEFQYLVNLRYIKLNYRNYQRPKPWYKRLFSWFGGKKATRQY